MSFKRQETTYDKYKKYLTILANGARPVSISRLGRLHHIDAGVNNALTSLGIVTPLGNNGEYKWTGTPVDNDLLDKIFNYMANKRKIKNQKRRAAEGARNRKINKYSTVIELSENDAIKLLKSKGYKIMKPITQFEEL
jgi:hypothetical protein